MSEILNRTGIHAVLGAGSLILNDYALSITPIDNGHRLTVTRGSETQTMDVTDGVGIVCVENTGSTGNVDSYRISFTDGSTFEYKVETNAAAHAAAEAARVEAEKSRVSAEAERVSAEAGRVNAEDARVAGEAARESAESARAGAESAREQAEDRRKNAEVARATAEQNRASAESARVAAENARVAAETARANAESERAGAETLRAAAETERANAESGRVSAEQGRVSAESDRVAAEEARATEFAGFSGEITQLKDELDFLHPLAITAFSVTPNLVEKGATLPEEIFSFTVNRMGAAITLEGQTVTGSGAKRTDTLTADRTYTLKAMLNGAEKTATAAIRFVAPVYYGASSSYALESANVLALTRALTTSRSRTFTVNAASGQYILYALPASLGIPTFKVGGFEGGFVLAGTFDFTNSSGHTESYRLYRSVNAGLGSTSVAVS